MFQIHQKVMWENNGLALLKVILGSASFCLSVAAHRIVQ